LNNNINYVLADTDIDATFLHRNLRNCGVDLIFCEKVGLKIWVYFKSEIAQNNLIIAINFSTLMNQNAEVTEFNSERVSKDEINLKPNLTFQYDNAMFRISILEAERAECIVIQSKNVVYEKNSMYQFDNLNIIREAIAKHLQM
jgi:hypothetical protein